MKTYTDTVTKYTFKNGVRACIVTEHQNPGLASFRFHTLLGDAPMLHVFGEDASGAAHFIEHCLFFDSDQYTKQELNDLMSFTGASINAHTSKDRVTTSCYAVIEEQYEKLYDVMFDMFFHPKFLTHQIDTEKRPVINEIRQYAGMIEACRWQNLSDLVYGENSVYSRPILGDQKAVQNLDSMRMKRFWSAASQPKNVILSFRGGVNSAQRTLAKWNSEFGGIDTMQIFRSQNISITESTDPFVPSVGTLAENLSIPYSYFENSGKVVVKEYEGLQQCQVNIVYPKRLMMPSFTEDFLDYEMICGMITSIVGAPFYSRMWKQFREEDGSCYSTGAVNNTGETRPGFMMQYGSYGVSDYKDIIEKKLRIMANVAKNGITKFETESVANRIRTRARDWRPSNNLWNESIDTAMESPWNLESSWMELNSNPADYIKRMERVIVNKGRVKWSDVLHDLATCQPNVLVFKPK